MADKKKKELAIRSSAAEYLTFVASTGESDASFEMRYEDENIWLTQKMMAALYDVGLPTINEHIKKIYADGELTEEATIRKFRIVQTEGVRQVNRELTHYNLQAERKIPMSMEDWAKRLDGFLEFNGNELLTGPGKISAEQAKLHAETEYEKYRIIQDCLYESDFDRFLMLEQEVNHKDEV